MDGMNDITDDIGKLRIISMFRENVKGKKVDTNTQNTKHCGKEGHWLEQQMGIQHNSRNEPDIDGYEMKKESSKTTLGDFSATEYAFSKNRTTINEMNHWTTDVSMTRSAFIRYFGNPNCQKNNRYSWSGSCVPRFGSWNSCGQILSVTAHDDIVIQYSFDKDTRETKHSIPEIFRSNTIVIAFWKADILKRRIETKFNQKGFFICKKKEDVYDKICFGKPFNYDYFIESIKNKRIIFDSGMYEGNRRNYSQFRGSSLWDELIVEEYV